MKLWQETWLEWIWMMNMVEGNVPQGWIKQQNQQQLQNQNHQNVQSQILLRRKKIAAYSKLQAKHTQQKCAETPPKSAKLDRNILNFKK
jgi:predicted HTH transcriptional regulator